MSLHREEVFRGRLAFTHFTWTAPTGSGKAPIFGAIVSLSAAVYIFGLLYLWISSFRSSASDWYPLTLNGQPQYGAKQRRLLRESETVETLQEHSDEAARRSPAESEAVLRNIPLYALFDIFF